MADEVRKRAACDRCNAQKTRCPRKPGQEICDRCVKAKATCVFSPFRQKKVPGNQSSREPFAKSRDGADETYDGESSDSIDRVKRKRFTTGLEASDSDANLILDNSSLDFEADWMSQSFTLSGQCIPDINDMSFESQESFMSFDFSAAIPNDDFGYSSADNCSNINPNIEERRNLNRERSLKATAGLLMEGDDGSSPSVSTISGSSDYIWGLPPQPIESGSTAYCVKKLSELSIELFDHSQTIPPHTVHDSNAPENMEKWVAKAGQQAYAVEDTFRLTQAMIEIYPSFLSAFTNQKEGITTSPRAGPIDYSSVLLILSCHLRLISVYEELFKHMDICVIQKGVPLTMQQKLLKAPELKIGSYVPPTSSVISMQILLLVQFATQLFQYASDLVSEIRGTATSPSSDSSSNASPNDSSQDAMRALTAAAAENVKDRASSMSRQLSALRTSIIATGIPA